MSINLLTHVVSTLFLKFWPLVPCFCGSQKKDLYSFFGLFLVTTLLKVFWIHKSKNLKLVSTCIEISVPLPTLLTCNLTLIPFQVLDQWITNFWFRLIDIPFLRNGELHERKKKLSLFWGESLFESRVEFSKDQYLRILNFILFRHLWQASQVIVENAKLPVWSQCGWKKSRWDQELFSISSIPSQQTPEKIQLTNFVYL